MADPQSHSAPVGADTLITIKVAYDGANRRFKLPLRDLGAHSFPQKLRECLGIPVDTIVNFERYSDSAGSYMTLDSENHTVYKQLYRAAKAKLKLRIRATVVPPPTYEAPKDTSSNNTPPESAPPRYSYLNTVLRSPSPPKELPEKDRMVGMWPEYPPPAPVAPAEPEYKDELPKTQPTPQPAPLSRNAAFAVCIDCNYCGSFIPNEHYHCSICDGGDYDLCPTCVNEGVLCPGDGHWLIKRFLENGAIINSTTETIAPKRTDQCSEKRVDSEDPAGTPADEPNVVPERTCNACFQDFDEGQLVTCKDCHDYDLCFSCLIDNAHGHHPSHTFSLIHDSEFGLKDRVLAFCQPGRLLRHAAICDGCEKAIRGVRNKCLQCPDFDYCSECMKNAPEKHPGHRFAPLYETISQPKGRRPKHHGIFCDGVLCKKHPVQSYIRGVRYKCAVCNDTDFCENCEAHPLNVHNPTHPLIKLKTPVRDVSVSTYGDNGNGDRMVVMGDRRQSAAANATTPETAAPQWGPPTAPVLPISAPAAPVDRLKEHLQALFVRDTIPNGSQVPPNHVMTQTWTVHNPGPNYWPKGCCLRFVGGDPMFNIDKNHPSSVANLMSAMQTKPLETEVKPYSSVDFSMTLKSPDREGRAISHWRLKAPDGTPFGHKLWCDVTVRASAAESQTPLVQVSKSEEGDAPAQPIQPLSLDEKQSIVDAEETGQKSESTMVFPKLEKESPEASMHEAAPSSPSKASQQNTDEQDVIDDIESLTLDDNESDGYFETDDEYDILDASDQEFIADAEKAQQRQQEKK